MASVDNLWSDPHNFSKKKQKIKIKIRKNHKKYFVAHQKIF